LAHLAVILGFECHKGFGGAQQNGFPNGAKEGKNDCQQKIDYEKNHKRERVFLFHPAKYTIAGTSDSGLLDIKTLVGIKLIVFFQIVQAPKLTDAHPIAGGDRL
jgi:hypothetical protein